MPDWTLTDHGATLAETHVDDLAAEKAMNQLLQESIADLEAALARDNMGWARIDGVNDAGEFTAEGRLRAAALAEVMSIANPLIKRGLLLRVGYIHGDGGPKVTVRDDGAEGQDVHAVVREFLDDNAATFHGSEARQDLERNGFGVAGEVFLALPTVKGRVRVRQIPPEQITVIITDPEDAATPWYYRREWVTVSIDPASGLPRPGARNVEYFPALGFTPAVKARAFGGHPVRWDAPVLHKAVNKPRRSDRGLGDAFAALPWARMSKEFLESWAVLMRALSRFAWQKTTRGDKAKAAAARLQAAQQQYPREVGATLVNTTGETLEAIPKTGATIDATSGQPLQQMVAAAIGVPVTMLLGDPGTTGARAVAETLDQPTENEMGLRRDLWTDMYRLICGYVIDQAVISGRLRGTITRQGDRLVVDLPADDGREVDIDWPAWSSTPVDVLVKAIQTADQTDKLPPLTVVRLLCAALGIEDVDEVVDQVTDSDGNFVPQQARDADVLQRMLDRGGSE